MFGAVRASTRLPAALAAHLVRATATHDGIEPDAQLREGANSARRRQKTPIPENIKLTKMVGIRH
ncbi:hypothetical protein QZM22_14175 [Burkholderia oklahomensis]|uniref:hypothetical protein n=1 Tax=Burkholderia oklahomensis TaxID=342113 RepID=UPI00264FAE4E|nr:hypothetical protein [Burkholderia oklahomensis]MDN7673633.1 hypothetical protein [Burkholderia oklahomensis]